MSKIGLYVCGLTVYDDCHIGHARLFIWFDVVVRFLRSSGFEVTYVRNITDIDDKIIKRANELNIDYKMLANDMIAGMHENEKKLHLLPPSFEPRVTDHILDIMDLIKILVSKDFAYYTKSGDVYFDIAKFKDYGKLAHQDLESLRSGIRVELNENKKDPLDFVLWKSAKPGEPFWDSPWGRGRPGWHIECSAMAKKYLGDNFDIHGGGSDLQFPHHQNELAQSEAANSCKFVNCWMHIGFVQVDNEKMSKSLGNFCVLKDVLEKYNHEVLRYFVVASHYRSPINFSERNLENAHAALRSLYISIKNALNNSTIFVVEPEDKEFVDFCNDNQFIKRFYDAMNDDFNTPKALAILFDISHEINRLTLGKEKEKIINLTKLLKKLGFILGILQENPDDFLKVSAGRKSNINKDEYNKINKLIDERNVARHNKNWIEADRIRNELLAMGIILEDNASGVTTWLRK